MTKKSIYHFDDLSETGIDRVPDDATIIIRNDGSGFPRQVQKLSGAGLTSSSTIQDFLNDPLLSQPIADPDVINADTVGTTSTTTAIWTGTQPEYDNLGAYDGSTLYFIRA